MIPANIREHAARKQKVPTANKVMMRTQMQDHGMKGTTSSEQKKKVVPTKQQSIGGTHPRRPKQNEMLEITRTGRSSTDSGDPFLKYSDCNLVMM
jgi:hypothetical protein